MAWKDIIPFVYATLASLLVAYVTVKVAVAEIKKDILYLHEKLTSESKQNKESENTQKSDMTELRNDVRAIFRTLTYIQVDVARNQGRDEVLNAVKESMEIISKKTRD